MAKKGIFIKGARVHNLRNIDVDIPRDKFVVITGISGSGKSSLAFDTIYAEGQRRYVESLSAYARQFLGVMQKPDVDYIEGLSPAISIEQRTAAKNPRSTVATVTEIYDYLRLLFARIGVPYCYRCGTRISSQASDEIVDAVLALPEGKRIQILAPLVRGRKGEFRDLFAKAKRKGYLRVRVDGAIYDLDSPPELDKNKKHTIEIVVDRLAVEEKGRKRIADSVETALKEAEGVIVVNVVGEEELIFSQELACTACGISYGEISPRMFSFNSPYGACPSCGGLGTKMEIDPELLIVNPSLSISEGAVAPWGEPRGGWLVSQLEGLARHYRFSLDSAWEELPERVQEILLCGTRGEEIAFSYSSKNRRAWEFEDTYEGIIPNLLRRYRQTESDWIRYEIEKYMTVQSCPECKGARLKKESLAIKVEGLNISETTKMSVKEALRFFSSKLKLSNREKLIASQVVKEIKERLGFLRNVGLEYLTLDRTSESLSGGEEQRVRLANQIGSGLVGVLYILDEPSVGLHQRDNQRLLDTLIHLRDLGNTILVVEHDRQTIKSADWVIDLGPGAGEEGGRVVAEGPPLEIARNGKSLTGQYLSGRRAIERPVTRRKPHGEYLTVLKAQENNLRAIDVRMPLGLFICITGVSGSGKSTLMNDIIYRALAKHFYRSRHTPGRHERLLGVEHLDKVINIDQSPIGRTPRSNPATYTGLFTYVRELFSETREAKVRGYKPGRFSFNVKGGRCEACAGDGIIKIEMHFLPDVYIPCEVCKGKRFNRETLEITYKGKSVADVLDMTVTEALRHFDRIPKIKRRLKLLCEVGLGYIRLGQPAPTLSGGEAQRVKLSRELSKVATGRTFYILDEPTTGLHFEDVKMLLKVLDTLVEKGNTVLIVEHNPDVIKCTDYIIDLGPEGGDEGGEIVVAGTPEEVAACPRSYTGQVLRRELGLERKQEAKAVTVG